MRVLGINAVFHDPAAAVAIDGKVVAAAEEERFSRRKHGKRPVPFSTWELPELAACWCLAESGIEAGDLDAIAYSYDAAPVRPGQEGLDRGWEALRTRYADRAPEFLATALPGLDPPRSPRSPTTSRTPRRLGLAAPFGDCAVLVLDGREEAASHLAGVYARGELTVLASQELPHSLGLMYEDVTDHQGFRRGQHEPGHRGPAHGGQSPRRTGVLWVRAGRRAGYRPVPGPPERMAGVTALLPRDGTKPPRTGRVLVARLAIIYLPSPRPRHNRPATRPVSGST